MIGPLRQRPIRIQLSWRPMLNVGIAEREGTTPTSALTPRTNHAQVEGVVKNEDAEDADKVVVVRDGVCRHLLPDRTIVKRIYVLNILVKVTQDSVLLVM